MKTECFDRIILSPREQKQKVSAIQDFKLEEGKEYIIENTTIRKESTWESKFKGRCWKNFKDYIVFDKKGIKTSFMKSDLINGRVLWKLV